MPSAASHRYFAFTTLPCMRQTPQARALHAHQDGNREMRSETPYGFRIVSAIVLVASASRQTVSQPTLLVDALLMDAEKEIETSSGIAPKY